MSRPTPENRSRRRVRRLLLAAGLAATVVAAGPAAQANIVTSAAFTFPPATIIVDKESPAYYVNPDIAEHDIVAEAVRPNATAGHCAGFDEGTCPLFWTPLVGTGGMSPIHGLTDVEAGTYRYYCSVHAGMTGDLIVEPL